MEASQCRFMFITHVNRVHLKNLFKFSTAITNIGVSVVEYAHEKTFTSTSPEGDIMSSSVS